MILSAGAVATPHILLNSGVGPAADVRAKGITSLVDLPDVGINLSDHVTLGIPYLVNSNLTYDDIFRNATFEQQELAKWRTTGHTILVDTLVSQLGFIRLPKNDPAFQLSPDPTAGPHSPHYEIVFSVSLCCFSSDSID